MSEVRKLDLKAYGFSGYYAGPKQVSDHGVVVIMGGESVMLPLKREVLHRVLSWLNEEK